MKKTMLWIVLGVGAALVSRTAAACHEVNICVKFGIVGTSDANASDFPDTAGWASPDLVDTS